MREIPYTREAVFSGVHRVLMIISVMLAFFSAGCRTSGPRSVSSCQTPYRGYHIVALLSAGSDVSMMQVHALEKVIAASEGRLKVLGLVLEKDSRLYIAWITSMYPVFRMRRVDEFSLCGQRVTAEPVLLFLDGTGRIMKVRTGYQSPEKIRDSLDTWPPPEIR